MESKIGVPLGRANTTSPSFGDRGLQVGFLSQHKYNINNTSPRGSITYPITECKINKNTFQKVAHVNLIVYVHCFLHLLKDIRRAIDHTILCEKYIHDIDFFLKSPAICKYYSNC